MTVVMVVEGGGVVGYVGLVSLSYLHLLMCRERQHKSFSM